MQITILTPTLDRVSFLEEAIESVLRQRGDFELEYIIADGGSGPELLDMCAAWRARVQAGEFAGRCRSLRMEVRSEPDGSMYQALARGFADSAGRVMGWINSDDVLHPGALDAVARMFEAHPEARWLAGVANSLNEHGNPAGMDVFPAAYSREFLRRGLHDEKNLRWGLHWIPQDSVFWRRSLWDEAGGFPDTDLRYAGDFFLWKRFALHADLYKARAFLGAYRAHGDQATGDPERYRAELPKTARPPRGYRFLYRLRQSLPGVAKGLARCGPAVRLLGLKPSWLRGPVLYWDFQRHCWEKGEQCILD